ncbi:hatching enzyme 1.2 [Hippoglossus stenolepis]|uniref:hatching enzyme 1.2 n=1 Tax=Hippoglossus stenolepis TaxID=195615 RepID=UPI001FAF0129|nr:hatching enzyme 1.2 [Hippoglossus stenolepis]
MEQSCSVMLRLLIAALLFAENLKDVNSSPVREASKVLQEDWFITALDYMESYPETLQELLSKNYAMLEGDMLLSTDRNAVERKWPTLKIPYLISPELASRTEDILSAITMVTEHTCLTFNKRTTETNHLVFKIGKGCASYVGLIGGGQPVFVAPQCIIGNIVHEILHALGFHHEHTRTDREQYITILPHNIMKGMQRNFNKQQGNTFNLPYDITSILHYGGGFFSANGLDTIVPVKHMKNMGQRVKLTKLDIERVRHLYKCDATETQTGKESGEVDKAGSGSNAEEEIPNSVIQNVTVSFNSTSRGNQSHVPARGKQEENPTASPQHLASATGGRNNTSQTIAPLQPLDTATGGRNNTSQTTSLN